MSQEAVASSSKVRLSHGGTNNFGGHDSSESATDDSSESNEDALSEETSGYSDDDDAQNDKIPTPSAEKEIEGDFECVLAASLLYVLLNELQSRLVQNIRVSDGISTTGMLSKDWDFNLEEREAEFRDDLREASGIGKKRKKVRLDPFICPDALLNS